MEYETFNMENVNYLKMIKFLKARFWLQQCLELITCLMEKKKITYKEFGDFQKFCITQVLC